MSGEFPGRRFAAPLWMLLAVFGLFLPAESMLFTAGTHGNLFPCSTCPDQAPAGGLLRAAPLIREHSGPWLDLGYAFTGGDLPPDELPVLVEAYRDLGVDAMNVSAGDFRHGVDFLHGLLANSGLPVVSANLVWADSGDLLFPATVELRNGAEMVTVIGLTEPPAGRNLLPHLKKQFEGVGFLNPAEALAARLDALPPGASVGVLYDGSPRGLRGVLRMLEGRAAHPVWIAAPASTVSAVEKAPPNARLIPVFTGGTRLTRFDAGAEPKVTETEITAASAPDPKLLDMVKKRGVAFPGESSDSVSDATGSGPSLEAWGAGFTAELNAAASNRGLGLTVHGLEIREEIGDRKPSPGRVFAVLDIGFENRQAIDLLLELDYPEPVLIGELRNQLFLVRDGTVVSSPLVLPEVLPLGLPQTFTLSSVGSRARGRVGFEIRAEQPEGLSLVYVPELFPALEAVLFGTGAPRTPRKAVAAETSDDFLGLSVVSVLRKPELDGFRASEGMEWAVVELQGTSLNPLELDARAVDAEAGVDAAHDTRKAAVYLRAHDMLQLVVDGRHATRFDPGLSDLESEPAFLPDRFTGGRVVFPVPADATSLDLYAGFPDLRTASGVVRAEPIVLPVEGNRPDVDDLDVLAEIDDDPLPVAITEVAHDPEEETVRIEVTVRNTGDQGGMYAASSRGRLRGPDDTEVEPLEVVLKGGIPMQEPMWIPAGNRPRSFSYRFRVPADATQVDFSYAGVTKGGTVTLDLTSRGASEPGRVVVVGETRPSDPAAATERILDALPGLPSDEPLDLAAVAWPAPEKQDPNQIVVEPPGEGIAVGRTVQTPGFSMTAHRLFVLDAYYDKRIGEGERLLAVEVEVGRLAEDPVEIESLEDVLLLRVDGRRLEGMRRYGDTDPQMPDRIRLDGGTPSVRKFVFYAIPETGVSSLELILAPREGRPVRLPLLPGEGAAEDAQPLSTAENRAVALGLYGMDVRENFLGSAASQGVWLVVDLRGISRLRSAPDSGGPAAPLRFHWREWKPRMQLIIDGVRTVMLTRDGHEFFDREELLPELWSGGRFAFDVPRETLASATTLQLQCGFMPVAFPGERVTTPETLYFTLKGDPESLPAPPEPLKRFEDLNVTVDLIRATRPEIVDGREAGEGASWVRLDLGVTATAEQGLWYDPDFLGLINPGRAVLGPHRHSWYGPDGAPNQGHPTWIPRGGRREFSMFWRVEDGDRPVRLRINGVKLYEAFDVFPGGDEAKGPDPESDRLISEQGIRVLNPSAEPNGIAGVGLTPEQVNRAIEMGRDYLWAETQKELNSRGGRLHDEFYPALLALVHCDAHLTYPEFDRVLRDFIRDDRVEKNSVYENALLAMIIEGYGDPSFLPKLEQIAHWLVETQGEEGTWSYHAPVPSRFFPEPETESAPEEGAVLRIAGGEPRKKVERPDAPIHRTQSWENGKNGDHSCTQFAVLGLWSAERAGIPIDDDVWERVLSRMSAHQTLGKEDVFGGYGYNGRGGAYGSMTGAGICVLAIAQNRLFDDVTPRHHLRIRNALGWLVRNFQVEENPGTGKYNYYYLYSLERVGRILGIDFMGEFEWYPLGAEYLVNKQNADGGWPPGKSENNPVLTSSYALLFLTKATPELDAEPEPEPTGPGTLSTVVERPETRHQVYLILDASGSMRPEIGGKRKLDIAREAVGELLETLPEGTRVAVRAYGHRKRAVEPGAEEDTELVVPWTDLDPEGISRKLESLRPMGKTPMALSLQQAAGEIRGGGEGKTLLVLLTDGGEDSRDTDPVAAAAAFAERGDVELFILGFDINRPDWTRQLKAMAEAGKGVYRPVTDATLLARDLKAVVYPPVPSFRVLDGEGNPVAAATFGGEDIELPEGAYTLQAPGFSADFHIRAGGATRVTLDMEHLPDTVETGPSEPEEAPAAGTPNFCTRCGNPLTSDAKFCTRCGNPVR